MKNFSRLLVALLIVASVLDSSSAVILAQGDSTVQPAETTQAPPPEAPTEQPLPTEILPTEIPPTEPTLPTATTIVVPTSTTEPTPTSTSAPTETPTPTITPTIAVSPTPTPSPSPTQTEESRFSAAATMGLTTSPPTTVGVGNTVTAQASGLVLGLLGTISYQWWDDGVCGVSGGAVHAAGGGVVVGSIPPSSAVQMTSLGSKSFKAHYSGDLTNGVQDSDCMPIIVAKRTPTITVGAPTGTLTAGSNSTATSSLTAGTFFNATGTVTYSIFPNPTCATAATTVSGPIAIVTPNTMPNSTNMILNRTGAGQTANLSWQVTYSGDANNNAATSPCVAKAVARAATTTTLLLSPSTVTTTQTTVATATLVNSVLVPSGTMTYAVFSNTTCTAALNPPAPIVKTFSGGSVAASDPFVIPTVGTNRRVRAVYSGDDNNAPQATAPCIAITVNRTIPVVNVTTNPTQISVNSPVTAQATLSGAAGIPIGTVTYAVFSNSGCTTSVTSPMNSTVTLAGGVPPQSSSATFTPAGTRYIRASYARGTDPGNNNAISACTAFQVRNAPTLSVAFSPTSINSGGSAAATSTLTGATAGAIGTVTYKTYSDAACANPLATGIDSTMSVNNATVPNSNSATFSSAGTYYVKATYSGDALNNPATSGCASLTVAKLSPSLTMSQSPNPVTIGGSFGYGFSLSGTSGTATGTVTLQLYTSNTCGTSISGQSYAMTVAGSAVPNSPSIPYVFAGTVYARSSYGGDANHNPATTSCVAVSLATGSMSASLSNATFNPLPYSNNAQVNSGQLVLTVTDPRGTAAGWSVSIVAGPFVYSGSAVGQGSIPAANFALTSTVAPTTVSGQPIGAGGPTATGATGALSTSRTIVVASPGYGSGTYNQIVNVNLTIPGTSKAGTYTSTMTVTTSAAP